MNGTLAEHGIRPFGGSEEDLAAIEYGSHVDLQRLLSHSINLRDLHTAATANIREGLIFRSSQVVSPSQLRMIGIKAVVDLRQAPVQCKVATHNIRQSFSRAASKAWLYITRLVKHPRCRHQPLTAVDIEILLHKESTFKEAPPCWRCTEAGETLYGVNAHVHHVDLLPGIVTVFIFAALPHRLQCRVVWLALTRRHPEPVVAAAIADPRVMGFRKLYRIVLHRSKVNIAAAMRLLLCDDNYPMLLHCIHGKDRTGLVVMLIYLLCGVPHDVIVRDYAQSESLLREGRESRQLFGLPEELATDEIIASVAHVMQDTIEYVHEKYGDVRAYLKSAGMREEEIDEIRRRLMPANG